MTLLCVRFAATPIALLLALLLAAGCDGRAGSDALTLTGATMGTTYSVVLPGLTAGDDRAPALRRGIDTVLEEVNALMSTYRADSVLSRFNTSPSVDWVTVDGELAGVVGAAREISAASGGAFDVTVGPVVNLWGFGPEITADELPTQAEIDAALARVGWDRLQVREEPPALRKTAADIYVDLSAIAKGYGVDRVAALLQSEGITDYLVEVGGELRGRGNSPRGDAWRIAIERPEVSRRSVFRIVELRDIGMATSGDYRNFFEVDGERYSHSIDPATGRPVTHRLASVTVLAASTMLADGWATALLVLGPERGFALAKARGIAALFIVRGDEGYEAKATTAFDAETAAD